MHPNSFEEYPENGERRSTYQNTINWYWNDTLANLNDRTGSWYLDTQTGQWLSTAPQSSQGARPSQVSTTRQPATSAEAMASVPSDSYHSTNHSNSDSAESTSGTYANASSSSSGYIPPTNGAESSPGLYVISYSADMPAPSSGTMSGGNASSQRQQGGGANWFNTVMNAPMGSPPSQPQPESHGNGNEVEPPTAAADDASASSSRYIRRSTRHLRPSRRAVESEQSSHQKSRHFGNSRRSKRARK